MLAVELFLNKGAGEFQNETAAFTNANGNGAVAWADYDNDGDLDLFTSRLYENDGSGIFTEKTGDALFDGTGHDALAFGDYDKDGFLDLIAGNKLYRNRGDKTFELKQTFNTGTVVGACWADFNGDSFVDILFTFECWSEPCQEMYYRNNADGTFTAGGLSIQSVTINMMAVFDYDSDGDLDIFAGTYADFDKLLRNDDGVFTEIEKDTHPLTTGKTTVYAVSAGDYDGDGDIDLYVGKENADTLFRNHGDGTFADSENLVLIASTSTTAATNFVDIDNDGDLDLFVGWTDSYGLFRNDGGGKFAQSTGSSVDNTIETQRVSMGDYDNDVRRLGAEPLDVSQPCVRRLSDLAFES